MTQVSATKHYEVPAEEMWGRIGDPGALGTWHPGVEATELVDGGRTRINTVPGGARLVEPILEHADHRYSYRIADSPLPLRDFVSTIRVRGDGGACVVRWDATFEASGVSETEATEIVRGFFLSGLNAL